MNLLKIRYFVEAARCGSFSAAAAKLFTAQPNISKQILQMEQELGFPLFIRDKRTVRLTAAGQFLFENLKDIPDQLEGLFEQAAALSRKAQSRVSIGILEGQDVRPQLLYKMGLVQERYPNLEVERNSFSNLRHGLQSGHYDLIVTLDFDVERVPEFRFESLYPQMPAIAINKKNPLSERETLDMTMLADEDFIVISPEESPVGFDRFVCQCRETGFVPKIVRKPRTLETLILCVEMGIGVALLDQNIRTSNPDAIRIVPIPDKDMSVVAACLRDNYSPEIEGVMKILTYATKDRESRGPHPAGI